MKLWKCAVMAMAVVCTPVLAQDLPEYACHPEHEGRGEAIDKKLQARLNETLKKPAREAIAAIESLRKEASAGSYAEGLLLTELARRYYEAHRSADAAAAASSVLQNLYVEGQRIDAMRALLAQIDADGGNWRGVVDALAPVAQQQCRSIASSVHYLLAAAYFQLHDLPAALIEIDDAKPQDDAEGVRWMRTALRIDCGGRRGQACAVRVLRYAQTPEPSAGLQVLLNRELAELAKVEAVRPMLDEARQAGLLDETYALVPRPPKLVEELQPTVRIKPEYPRAAMNAGQQGFVVLDIAVGSDGGVLEAKVTDSSPPGVFDDAAIKAAMKGRFRPQMVDGKPVATTGRYTIKFAIGP